MCVFRNIFCSFQFWNRANLSLLFGMLLQICPSLVIILGTMTSTWWCVATAVRWWSLRRSKSIAKGDTALWVSSMHTFAPPHRHLNSKDPAMDTPRPPMEHPLGVAGTRMSCPCGRLRNLPPRRLNSDTQNLQKMEFGKINKSDLVILCLRDSSPKN